MKRQQGFGLIEVLLAFIVVAVTAGSLLQLNKSYLEYSRDGRSREVALRLAESKLDEIRYFKDQQGYQDITGGTESTILDGVTYDLGWTVDDVGWDGTAWVKNPTISGKKEVAVTVDWNDTGVPQSFTLASVVSPNLSTSGGPFGTGAPNNGLGLGGPTVAHTPGAIPDIVSIELDPNTGIKQETSKPAPDIKKGKDSGDVVVSFETIVYNPSNKSLIKGDSQTVYCSCENKSSTEPTSKPAVPVVLSQSIYWKNGGTTVDKGRGVSENDNDDCEVCCNDHYDMPFSSDFSDNYNQFNKNHTHTGKYYESCRMLRIDGYYQVMPDWNLVALNVFPPGYLADASNVALYQKYVKYVIKDYVEKLKAGMQTASYKPTYSFEAWLNANGTVDEKAVFVAYNSIYVSSTYSNQFVARAIYVDLLPQELLDKIDPTNDADWLTRVSFNEVNVTMLADWSVSEGASDYIDVLSQEIETIVDPDNNYFGTYRRGAVKGIKTSLLVPKPVTATMKRYNTGLTGQPQISTFDGSNTYSASLSFVVQSGSPTTVSFGGVIECLTVESNKSTASKGCTKSDFNKTTVTASNGSCTINKEADVATATYQCTVPSTQSTTIVTFDETPNNSNFVFNNGASSAKPQTINLTKDNISNGNIPCILQVHNGIANYDQMSCTSEDD
ncbi:prepilin-type N-terminal cleavage/methylation domain-containing protein [uncultured Oceanisphaera sp.]|uniref:type IV pilus modification PilV family protein n=1 Tax=uncultured Oceanisphaera sp. TaxID=353858 RepID=UPI00260A3236|nr:prepilin-type N-terminal cleavage/methylation domain-containing protein [uncultured Oceanisphaera sp.]